MKKMLSVMLALVMALSMLMGTWALAEDAGKVKTTGSVNVRSGPGLDYESLGSVKKGTTFEYQGESRKDDRGVTWYRVKYDGSTKAWVSSRYATLSGASSGSSSSGSTSSGSTSASTSGKDVGYGTVKATASVNIRKGPGLSYKTLGSVSEGTVLTYRGERYRDDRGVYWYRVSYGGSNKAWISSTYASLSKGASTTTSSGASSSESTSETGKATPAPTPQPTPVPDYGSVSILASLNVRLGPGLDFDSIGTVGENKTLKYHGESCTDGRGVTWYRVTFDGRDDAWVSGMHSQLSTGSTTIATGNAESAAGQVKASANVNLRKGPGAHNEKLGTLSKGQMLSYMGACVRDNSGTRWYMVKVSQGQMGWICADYADIVDTPAPTATPAPTGIWAEDVLKTDAPEVTASPEATFETSTGSLNWFDIDEMTTTLAPATDFEPAPVASDLDATGSASDAVDGEGVSPFTALESVASAREIQGVHTENQILTALNVFESSQLEGVSKVQSTADGAMTQIQFTFEDGVFEGGTTGYVRSWASIDGVVSETKTDIDGDGVEEWMLIYGRTESGQTQWQLAIFESDGDGWRFADETQIHLGSMNERFVRLIDGEAGKMVFVGNVNYWDGGSGVIDGVIYSYADEVIWGEAAFSGTSVSFSYILSGRKFVPGVYEAIDAACQNYPYRPEEIAELDIQPGVNFESYDLGGYQPVMDTATGKINRDNFKGIEMIGNTLSAYGAYAGYAIEETETGEYYRLELSGGEVLLWMDEAFESDGIQSCLTMKVQNADLGNRF